MVPKWYYRAAPAGRGASTVRQFFERIIEWDWPGAPARNPVIAGDIPRKPEPLPKFPGDRDAARLMNAARASSDPRDRLVAARKSSGSALRSIRCLALRMAGHTGASGRV